jgi:hypothetical protein
VPASEQSQIALALSLCIFFDDLRIVRVEDTPLHRRPHTTARLALDSCDHATGCAEGVLLGRSGL